MLGSKGAAGGGVPLYGTFTRFILSQFALSVETRLARVWFPSLDKTKAPI